MNNLDNLIQDLTCPLTLELFEDPITVPCCGKAFSRIPLIQQFEINQKCPLCNADICYFNPETAAKNTVLSGMVESIQQMQQQQQQSNRNSEPKSNWKCILHPLLKRSGGKLPLGRLDIILENSKFNVKPTLFIAVVDKSGSMSGNPWKQVQEALIHILSMAINNPHVKVAVIKYDSSAEVVKINGNTADINRIIKSISAGGGTNFISAFEKIGEVLLDHKPEEIGTVNVAFMTDGQTDVKLDRLNSTFKKIIGETWTNPITVHSIGFGDCDKDLLEGLRKSGSIEGTFRYAQPGDDTDALCNKLTSLFELVGKASTVTLGLEASNYLFYTPNGAVPKMEIQFPVDEKAYGKYQQWILTQDSVPEYLQVQTPLNEDLKIPISVSEEKNSRLYGEWIAILIDELAYEMLELTKKKVNYSQDIFQLCCSLLEQRINAIELHLDSSQDPESAERIEQLKKEMEALRTGACTNLGRLSDLRFGSQYSSVQQIRHKPVEQKLISNNNNDDVRPEPTLTNTRAWTEYNVHYSRNNANKRRNALQESITNSKFDELTTDFKNELEKSNYNDIIYRDVDGNNALMLAAYCGHSTMVAKILEKYPKLNLEESNNDKEIAVTLAIKARGFDRSLKVLLAHGADIPDHRKKTLEQYAIYNGHTRTAVIIQSYSGNSTAVYNEMTFDYIMFTYQKAMDRNLEFDVQEYLRICVCKYEECSKTVLERKNKLSNIKLKMESGIEKIKNYDLSVESDKLQYDKLDLEINKMQKQYNELESGMNKDKHVLNIIQKFIVTLIEKHNAVPTINMLPGLFIENDDNALDLTKLLLQYTKFDINDADENGDTLVFKASERGSREHVKLLASMNADVDKPNNLGNTPLWIACWKRYPCIIDELLDNGANINKCNLKGNAPITQICQRGPVKIIEQLISRGADVDVINSNGDSLILLACRNGQPEVLQTLLNYVDPEIVEKPATIDGFNPILASAEQNRSECIKVLHEYGVNLEYKTSTDNEILPGATALHLATYYGKTDAVSMLLSLGANPNSQDMNGYTPMHIAILQTQVLAIKMLLNAKADLSIKDHHGNTPLVFCRSKELKQVLIDPTVDSLLKLARGEFTEEALACEIVSKHAGSLGCLSKKEAISIKDSNGLCPLIEAIIFSSFNSVKTFMEMGADVNMTDPSGLDATFWANMIGNPRIKRYFPADHKTTELVSKVKKIASKDSISAMALFIPPNHPKSKTWNSPIGKNMQMFINTLGKTELMEQFYNKNNNNSGTLTNVFDNKELLMNDPDGLIQNAIWNAKIFTVRMVASNTLNLNNYTEPIHIFALHLFTSSPIISKAINVFIAEQKVDIVRPYLHYLVDALMTLPPYVGEAYIGANQVDRQEFLVGKKICWPVFMPSSSIWRTATENTPEFSTNKKQGTVFIVKSKTGRFVGQYSQFTYDAQVIFLPNTTFTVTNWYMGDVFALGQANIRENSYKVKEEDLQRMISTNKSLIIELTEN